MRTAMRSGSIARTRMRSACTRMWASSDSEVRVKTSRVTREASKAAPMIGPSETRPVLPPALPPPALMWASCAFTTRDPLPCLERTRPSLMSSLSTRWMVSLETSNSRASSRWGEQAVQGVRAVDQAGVQRVRDPPELAAAAFTGPLTDHTATVPLPHL